MKKLLFLLGCLLGLPLGIQAQAVKGNIQKSVRCQTSLTAYFLDCLNGIAVEAVPSQIIKRNELREVRNCVWQSWVRANEDTKEEKLIPLTLLNDSARGTFHIPAKLEPDAVMPYYYGKKEGQLENGQAYPFFVYVHGSGPKEHEWATGLKICSMFEDAPSVYFIPQIPNEGVYYRWWQKSKQYVWEKLLRQALASGNVDPNKIYFFGISEGGYGSQRLASFYADYLAAAGPMAGGEPLKNAPVENCRNIGFSLRTGTEDYGFYRNILSTYVKEAFDSLQTLQPDGFEHNVELIPGCGHHIDYRPTTPWLRKFVRNPYPKHVTWEDFEMDSLHRKGFYNIRVDKRPNQGKNRTYYEMVINGNQIDIQVKDVIYKTIEKDPRWGIEMKFEKSYRQATDGAFTLYLCDELVDLSRKVIVTVNGKRVFKGKLKYDVQHLVNSCITFYDPERLFPAGLTITY